MGGLEAAPGSWLLVTAATALVATQGLSQWVEDLSPSPCKAASAVNPLILSQSLQDLCRGPLILTTLLAGPVTRTRRDGAKLPDLAARHRASVHLSRTPRVIVLSYNSRCKHTEQS